MNIKVKDENFLWVCIYLWSVTGHAYFCDRRMAGSIMRQ